MGGSWTVAMMMQYGRAAKYQTNKTCPFRLSSLCKKGNHNNMDTWLMCHIIIEKILGGDKDRPYVTVLGARNSRLR